MHWDCQGDCALATRRGGRGYAGQQEQQVPRPWGQRGTQLPGVCLSEVHCGWNVDSSGQRTAARESEAPEGLEGRSSGTSQSEPCL